MRSLRLGPYRLQRLIGSGGQGSVYLASDQRLRRWVAVKLYRLPQIKSYHRQIIDEARLLAEIDHPRVVKVHDIVAARGVLAVVTEYVPGCDLGVLLSKVALSVPSILGIAQELAGALTAARRHRVVHRDLKPANVLVARDGHIKLTDFGIAITRQPLSQENGAWGSAECLAPELAAGEAATEHTDLFALGLLLYRLLCGAHPFYVEGALDRGRLSRGEFLPCRDAYCRGYPLPAGLPELVDGLLSANPDTRPDSVFDVRRQLVDIWNQLPVSVSSQLASEARPWFREGKGESIPDFPVAELTRSARSWLRPFRLSEPWTWLNFGPRRNPGIFTGLVLASVLIAVLLYDALFDDPGPVLVDTAIHELHRFTLPEGVNRAWMEEQAINWLALVSPGLYTHSLSVVTGRFSVDSSGETQDEVERYNSRLQLRLFCRDAICILRSRWQEDDALRTAQALLTQGMDKEDWSDTISELLGRVILDQ